MKLSEIKQINESQFLMDPIKIEKWLKKMKITNYSIRSDGVVDVDRFVDLRNKKLTSIPVQFGKVTGWFNCANNELTSLAGCPTFVYDNFFCFYNYNVTSLEGISYQIKKIDGTFYCSGDLIKSHVLGLMLIEGLTGIGCNNKSNWSEILNHCIQNGLGIYDAQTMLNDARLEEYAQL